MAPFSVERGKDVPEELTENLADRADSYRPLLEKFTCVEKVLRGGKHTGSFDYLLTVSDDAWEFRELRFAGRRRVGDRKTAMPPAPAWGRLFSDSYQPYFVYRYLGHSLQGFDQVHRVLFRGNLDFRKGTDIREWEGLATVDAMSYDVVSIQAMPRSYAEHAEFQHRRQLRSMKIVIETLDFSVRRAPVVPFLEVNLDEIEVRERPSPEGGQRPRFETARLPREVRLERHRLGRDGNVNVIGDETRRYSNYRFFDVEAATAGWGR